ncbi:hypothetical protein G9A89_006478 [Geosiphon pyriformis]|nr:hypothetical protein G9A89_006478 [Geosiphon pyriformis]
MIKLHNTPNHLIFKMTTTSKVATQTDSRTLEYYQSIYTHCKQRFNIPDGIETFKKTLYQYIENRINNYFFGDYNISEVRHNLYESLVHHSHLNTQDFNSQTLETYFQKLNFNIIQYCKKNYPVEQKFSLSFESETEKGKGKRKQKLRTTPNIPKTTAKYLQTPEQRTSFKLPLSITLFPALLVQPQTPSSPLLWFSRIEDFQSPRSPIQQQKPISTSTNLIDYLTENRSEETESEQETEDSENEEKMASTYITKIFEFTGEDNKTSSQEWLDKVSKAGDANGWNAAKMLKAISYFLQGMVAPPKNWEAFKTAFLEQFTDNNTSITLRNCESVITYLEKFNKLLRRICQLKTNEYYFNAQILDQFIARLKDKLIKKVCPYAPEDLATAIQQTKNYEMAIEEANYTKLVNLVIGETSLTAEEKIDQLTKKVENYFINQQQQQQPQQSQQLQRYQPLQQRNQNNFGPLSNNQIQNCHYYQQQRNNQHYFQPQQLYYLPSSTQYLPRPQYPNHHYQLAPQPIQQQYQQLSTPQYQVPARRLIQYNQFISQNCFSTNNNRFNSNNQLTAQNSNQHRPTHYYTQPSETTAPRQNPSNNTISPARIAQNANFLDIFSFKFEANESPFLLSNVTVNKQKAITVMYIEAKVEGKPIRLILDNGSAGSIITYQLMQQLQQTIDRPAQTVIITADGMKKTPVEKIDNFLFTIDGITISVKVLVMDAPQYQALIRNDWLLKTNANLDWEIQELKISYQG